MLRIAFSTLGCKINQFDTALMQSSVMQGNDFSVVSFDDEADIYVINTCTVTGKSDAESRRTVRRAFMKNRNARIVVTGCYAQTNPQEIAEIPGVSAVIGNFEKLSLRDYLGHEHDPASDAGNNVHVSDISVASSMHMPVIEGFRDKTRAILKIQDGCDSRCSYCIVPFARGASRSLAPDDVIEQARSLCGKDYREVVLSGVHLGGYGRDLSPKTSLSDVMSRILSETDIQRIRLSSIEPREVTDELIELMAGEERICRHFHIPLQSGDDRILHMMNRNYDSAYYEGLIMKISDRIQDAGIGCDVMVGYPGEEDNHFESTYRLIDKLPLSYLHVFAYSPREGTGAFSRKETVKGNVKASRSAILRRLGEEKNLCFKRANQGKTVEVLVEEDTDEETGLLKGYTGNYLRVLIEEMLHPARYPESASVSVPVSKASSCVNRIVRVLITGITGDSLSGKLCG